MQNDDDIHKLEFVKRQFLCNVPIKEICWQNFCNPSTSIQEQIINKTVRLESVLAYPLNVNYQKAFLKHLLQYLEKQGAAIADALYEEYARLVALPNNNTNFKHYHLQENNKNIILKEDIHLISEGTTGLRTWQASLALSEWILANKSYFNSKRILELGSGIGLLGLVLLKCKPKAVYLSDCHNSVLTALCDNIQLNLEIHNKNLCNLSEQILLQEHTGSSVVYVLNLPWENIAIESRQLLGQIDIVLAADVVYDESNFKPLISAVDYLFKYCGAEHFILSCTERNKDTLDQFLALLTQEYKVCDIEVPLQRNFLWAAEPAVRIFDVTKL